MSEVISFRLDNTNPREAQGLEVLNAWVEKGFSTRFILTTALLKSEHYGSEMESDQGNRDLSLVLEQIGQLIEIVKANPIAAQSISLEKPILHENFLASIKQGAKPGMKSA